jgi:hypothetical protein
MWARLHKVDRIRPQPNGGAIVLVEDERSAAEMSRTPSLSTLCAVARVLNAHRVVERKYDGKGEVRYATNATLPAFLSEAIGRAGASIWDGKGERVLVPAQPAAVSSIVDQAFNELAHHVRASLSSQDIPSALELTEKRRRKAPLDRDANPAAYWGAVLELAALAGELSRSRGGRWIDTKEMPIPFAIKLSTGEQAMPTRLAEQIVSGNAPDESMTPHQG